MMKFRILTIAILVLIPTSIFAQFNRSGIRIGVNNSGARITNGDVADYYGTTGFNGSNGFSVGFVGQSSENGIFVKSMGMDYSLKRYTNNNAIVSINYLQVPVQFRMRIPVVKKFAFQFGLGPYFSYAFYGKEIIGNDIDEDILGVRKKQKVGIFKLKNVKPYDRFDAGLLFGGDLEYVLPNNSLLLLGAYYEFGVSTISNEQPFDLDPLDNIEAEYLNIGLKNTTLNLSLTFMFSATPKEKEEAEE